MRDGVKVVDLGIFLKIEYPTTNFLFGQIGDLLIGRNDGLIYILSERRNRGDLNLVEGLFTKRQNRAMSKRPDFVDNCFDLYFVSFGQ